MTTLPTLFSSTNGFLQTSHETSSGSLWLCRLPLLVAAALICLTTALNVAVLVTAKAPRNPWEATQVIEGWRSLQGMPVYEHAPDGHSTQIYGALAPLVQGEIFRWVGPNSASGRVLSLMSALVLVALLAMTMRGERSTWYFVFACAALLGVNHRAGQYFAENKPRYNSLLPPLMAIMAFCVLHLPRLLRALNELSSPLPPRMLLGGMLAFLLVLSTFPHMSQDNNLLASRTSFDLEYDSAVSSTPRLPGRVVCPEDPTIPLYAKGSGGLSVFAERDAHIIDGHWPTTIPDTVLAECREVDYVVDVSDYWQDPLKENSLRTLGFEPAPDLTADLHCYHIWRRKSFDPALSLSHMTLDETYKDASP